MTCPPGGWRRRRNLVFYIVTLVVFTLFLASNRLASQTVMSGVPAELPADIPKPSPKADSTSKPEKPKKRKSRADAPMAYGVASRPMFAGKGHLHLLRDLPPEHVPSRTNNRRLIVVGDVHGMSAPLRELLDKVGFKSESGDHLIFTGDMVNKGPDSAGVIDIAMKLGASAVRGNHEDRVLLASDAMKSAFVADGGYGTSEDDLAQDNMEQQHFSKGDYEDRSTARALSKAHISWLADLPVILHVGPIEGLDDVAVVHAGLVPGLPLEKQDPRAVMNMRSLVYPRVEIRREEARDFVKQMVQKQREGGRIRPMSEEAQQRRVEDILQRKTKEGDRDIFVPVDGREGDSWPGVWDKFQEKHDVGQRMTVIYGHDPKTGLVSGSHTFGLDTGCVKGGKLTALVITGATDGVKHEFVQVDCPTKKG